MVFVKSFFRVLSVILMSFGFFLELLLLEGHYKGLGL